MNRLGLLVTMKLHIWAKLPAFPQDTQIQPTSTISFGLHLPLLLLIFLVITMFSIASFLIIGPKNVCLFIIYV